MLSRQDDGDPAVVRLLLRECGDLLPELLLYLHPSGERLDGAGKLWQAGDPLAREHADLGESGERQQKEAE